MIVNLLKKYYRLLIAAILTIALSVYYSKIYSTDYESSVQDFQSEYYALETQVENILDYSTKEIRNNGIHKQWTNLREGDYRFNIHVYRNDSLLFWNTNQLPIIRFKDIHFPSDGLLNLQNGWYFARAKTAGRYTVCISALVKKDYAYENSELINAFDDRFELPFSGKLIVDENIGYPIYSKKKEYVCSIVPDEVQIPTENESVVLMLLVLATVVAWLVFIFKLQLRFSGKWPRIAGIGIPVGLVIIRLISIKYGWLDFMEDTKAYSPSLYGANVWFPNFLEYLLNVAFIIYILVDLGWRFRDVKENPLLKTLSLVLLLLSILVWPMMIMLIKGLVLDSSIPMVINQLFSLNSYSLLAMASIGALFFAYFLFVRNTLLFSLNQSIPGSQLSVICFAMCCAYFLFEINYGEQLLFAGMFPMFFYGIALFFVFRTKGVRALGTGLILLSGFSIVISATIGEFGKRREQAEKELYANQLANEQDIVTEVEYSKVAEKLQGDKFLKRFISSKKSTISLNDFQENLERRFFNGFWEGYEMNFSLFNENHEPLVGEAQKGLNNYKDLQKIIDSSGIQSEINSSIYYVSDYQEQYSYIIRQHLIGKDSTKAILFCTLKSKKIPEEIGFPRLLISGQTKVFESLELYSIAKYHNSSLVRNYGEFNYPSSYYKMTDGRKLKKGFFNYGEFNHYLLAQSSDDIIVLSTKNTSSLDELTSFSYLFSFYGLLLLPLLFRRNSSNVYRRTLSLAMKIQIVLISLVFLSLLAFGWGSGIFVSNQYNQYTNDVIREKLSSVETEVKAKLGAYDELSITENGEYMQYILQKFSRVFFTDINLYDTDGYLLATSRPKVFNKGLLSEQMNPMAFKNMKYGQKSEFVHHENIGELNYSSAYQPFHNKQGKRLAFINLQHFGQQSEFENQIQKFLVAIINVFILLLAISIILAILISNWLTAPLRIIQESFAGVKFGTHNEPISYNKEDEIGSLVKDYNQKLEELEFTAQQLARSERESAWREMAKQVAHEIKNPLTPMKLSVQQLLRSYNPEDPKSEAKLQRVANSIIEQIDALTKIANEFATFAKMPIPSEERLEILELVRNVKEVFETSGSSDIKLISNEEKIYVQADKDQIIRVFNNLIKNSIQAIPDDRNGAIRISVETEGEKVKIEVVDNGVGIEKSRLGKIFVPYFTTKSTGTGLGLAMVKQIIENHKGTIDFDTEEGVGTTFFIELPLEREN